MLNNKNELNMPQTFSQEFQLYKKKTFLDFLSSLISILNYFHILQQRRIFILVEVLFVVNMKKVVNYGTATIYWN